MLFPNKRNFLLSLLLFLGVVFLLGYFLFGDKNAEKIIIAQRTENKTENKEVGKDINKQTAKQAEKKTINKKRKLDNEKKEVKNEKIAKDRDKENSKFIVGHFIDWGFNTGKVNRKIDTIIIHSSYDAFSDNPYGLSGLLSEYKRYNVSAHFLIDREGNVYQLVAEKNIAWHAGTGQVPDGRKNVNSFSIGIELMNTKKDKYTDNQYKSLRKLLSHLKGKYKIKYILGHNDIAPGRKTDPWNFQWNKIK